MRAFLTETLVQPRFSDGSELLKQLDGDLNLIDRERRRHLLDSIVKADLLILDDLSEPIEGECQYEMLEYIIGYRYRQLLPICITTRSSLGQLRANFGVSIFSRLSEMCRFVRL
jgi:DNA replication protein DnaC